MTTSNINYEELIKIINECELKYVEQIYNDSDDSDSDFDLKFEWYFILRYFQLYIFKYENRLPSNPE